MATPLPAAWFNGKFMQLAEVRVSPLDRAFLYGEIGAGKDSDKYKLLLLLSDQELKRPQAPTEGSP